MDQKLGWGTGSLWHKLNGKNEEIKNGETVVDFSSPHEVQVWRKWGGIWAGADIGYYRVTVRHKQGADGKAELKNLTFAGVDEKPVLRGLTYSLNVAPSVDRSKMVPTFQLSDGATANIEPGKVYDLSKPLTVQVTSRRGTVQNRYTIQVSAQANNQAEVVSFRFREIAAVPVIRGTSISCFEGYQRGSYHYPDLHYSGRATVELRGGTALIPIPRAGGCLHYRWFYGSLHHTLGRPATLGTYACVHAIGWCHLRSSNGSACRFHQSRKGDGNQRG